MITFVVALCAIPISFFAIRKSQAIILDKTFELCKNTANNIVAVARDELFLDNVYQDTSNFLQKIKKSQLKALKNIYIINVYGKYVVEMNTEKKDSSLTTKELEYFKNIDKETLDEITLEKANVLRFSYPVFLDEEKKMRIGMAVLDFDKEELYQPIRDIQYFIYILGFIIFVIAVMVSVFTAVLLTRPIRNLSAGVNVFANGNLDYRINISSSDEIGKLASSFNNMANSLEKADELKESYIQAYQNFVPTEFVTFLDKKSILDITLGDQIQKEMSILFSDIRSFTTISETLTPKENFNFINSYLSRMGPIVRDHEGFIDKYIGDAIMALFSGSVNQAIDAAIAMQVSIIEYNKFRKNSGYVPIQIGIGIHTGNLMLGIIGENKRMEGTVISDSVNLAARLESLTKDYAAKIIISESTFAKATDIDKYKFRMLGNVNVKGKKKDVSIFEILDCLPEDEVDKIYNTKRDFEKGILMHSFGEYKESLEIWKDIHQRNPQDKTIEHYIKECEYNLKYGLEKK